MGEFRELTGRQRWCDGGTVHVLFIPDGRTIEDVIADIRTFGRLAGVNKGDSGMWVNVVCPGGPDGCICQDGYLADDFHSDAYGGFIPPV